MTISLNARQVMLLRQKAQGLIPHQHNSTTPVLPSRVVSDVFVVQAHNLLVALLSIRQRSHLNQEPCWFSHGITPDIVQVKVKL